MKEFRSAFSRAAVRLSSAGEQCENFNSRISRNTRIQRQSSPLNINKMLGNIDIKSTISVKLKR